MSEVPHGIDLSVTNGVRCHVAVKRLRKQLKERRKAAGERGPEGRPLCLWCLKEVPPRCSVWCSNICTETFYSLTDWNTLKNLAAKRDQGICVNCKLDCAGLERERHTLYSKSYGGYGDTQEDRFKALAALKAFDEKLVSERGFLKGEARFSLYQIDHIIPLAEGGSNHVDNLRTLCIPCHKRETKAMHRRLADGRRSRIPLITESA